MSVFKKIDSNDISITTFNAHKNYTINSYNYSGSGCGYGVQILGANYHSWSFGDAIHGKALDLEEKNPNGTYKSIIYDSAKHLYYSRVDKPSENFGGNLPERESRDLQAKAHIISIPSPLFDLKIKPGSLNFTDHYIESMKIDRERNISSSGTPYAIYDLPVKIANHWKFETSESRYTDNEDMYPLADARISTAPGTMVLTGSSAGAVGNGSMLFKVESIDSINGIPYNVGNGLLVRDSVAFKGVTPSNWWESINPNEGADTNVNYKFGMPAYTVTMWVKPPDWNTMPNNVTGAPGQSTILTRDKNSYFELNMLTSSYDVSNNKGILPLQMFFGATGSNCTTSASAEAVSDGFGLATGSWNLVSVTQEFWPGEISIGTSGSQYEELPAWGDAAKTTLRIYRPDPSENSGFKYIKKVGYATASVNPGHWADLTTRSVTSSIQYSRNMYIGASGSVAQGALNNNSNATTLRNAFTGSIDDVRFYESAINDTQLSNLYKHPEMELDRTPPVTASFNLVDDGYGNIIDRSINSSSFANPKKLVGYYGFNELYTIEGQVSKSSDYKLHDGFGTTYIKDYSIYENEAVSDKVKYVPGIASMISSGSIKTYDSVNFYQTDVNTGIRAQFNNSGSIRIPHHSKLNLGSEDGFAISFWIKIPEHQIPGVNTIIGSTPFDTTGIGGSAGGTSENCVNKHSGSSAGVDYITLLTKSGLGSKTLKNAANGVNFDVKLQGPGQKKEYPYHIQLKNTSYEKDGLPVDTTGCYKDGAPLNTIVLRRSDGINTTLVESNISLQPYIDNHVIVQKHKETVSIWINGKLVGDSKDSLKCTDNISDVFVGDEGTAWVTGSKNITSIESNFMPPENPFSGSIDELRFYDTSLTSDEILSLYDNNFTSPTAYQTNVVGNVFYEHGIVALTNTQYPMYFSGSLHSGTAIVGNNSQAIFSKNFQLKFQNTRELYEQQIKCHTKASDFNLTTNPTARKITYGKCDNILSVQELADFAKDPIFNPYVTTIGLYDDFGRLLAIAKLARPIQKLKNVDMTFIVKFDK